MKILVCGGRNFNDYPKVRAVLYGLCDEFHLWEVPDEDGNTLPTGLIIIQGGAKGADYLADQWAVVNWVPVEQFKADWDMWGKAAGPIRNQRMLDEGNPDLVIAFPGGRGTADMIRRAKKAGIEVRQIDE